MIAALGIVIFNVAPYLDWAEVDLQGGQTVTRNGYDTDSLIPFIAYVGIGLLIAMIYALQRASRGQHRGLTLVSMAIGIAAAIQCVAFTIDPMDVLGLGDDVNLQAGVFVAIAGAALWAIGSGVFASEIEGDDHEWHEGEGAVDVRGMGEHTR